MPKPIQEMPSWDAGSDVSLPSLPVAGDWHEQTALATQLLAGDRGQARDVGQRLDERQHELFVSCAPAEAIRQQFEALQPEFIALHDLGTQSSRRFVGGVAAALGVKVQRLFVRRHGLGVPLATLEFVELPTDGPPLRLYTTQIDADTQSRQDLSRTLLAFSRLGVVMVGDLPSHALASGLKPIADAIAAGPWPNRQLLMLPLVSASSLAAHAANLGQARGVTVRTTPQVAKPNDAWYYLAGSWTRLREELANNGVVLPEIGSLEPAPPSAAASAQPSAPAAALQPMPDVPRPTAAAPSADPLQAYLAKLLGVDGMISACVFELATQRGVAHAGARPGPALLCAQGAALAGAMIEASLRLGFGVAPPEAAITLGQHHLLLRPLPGNPGLMLHAVLDRSAVNLTRARLEVARLDDLLEPA